MKTYLITIGSTSEMEITCSPATLLIIKHSIDKSVEFKYRVKPEENENVPNNIDY